MKHLKLNDEDIDVEDDATLLDIIGSMNLSNFSVRINGRQVLKKEYNHPIQLNDGDHIKVLRILGGG